MNVRDHLISILLGGITAFLTATMELPVFLLPLANALFPIAPENPVPLDQYLRRHAGEYEEIPQQRPKRAEIERERYQSMTLEEVLNHQASYLPDIEPPKNKAENSLFTDADFAFRKRMPEPNTESLSNQKEESPPDPEPVVSERFLAERKKSSNTPPGVITLAAAEGDFHIKITPVTVAEYRRFNDFISSPHSNPADVPATGISHSNAKAFCRFWGKQFSPSLNGRLPSLYEWQVAAQGGNAFARFGTKSGELSRKLANYGGDKCCIPDATDGFLSLSPVTAFPPNPFGLYDMAGNVFEWTSTMREGMMHVTGGSFRSPPFDLLIQQQWLKNPRKKYDDVGFRCAADKQ